MTSADGVFGKRGGIALSLMFVLGLVGTVMVSESNSFASVPRSALLSSSSDSTRPSNPSSSSSASSPSASTPVEATTEPVLGPALTHSFGEGRTPWNTVVPLPDAVTHQVQPRAIQRLIEEARAMNLSILSETGNTNRLCAPSGTWDVDLDALAKKTVSLAVVTMKTPESLENSLKSWSAGGMLDMFDQRLLWANAATESDKNRAAHYNFTFLKPEMIHPLEDFRFRREVLNPYSRQAFLPDMVKMAASPAVAGKPKAWRVGPTIAFLLDMAGTDFMLFLEKDFMLDPGTTREKLVAELLNAIMFAARGHTAVRLRSRADMSSAGFPDCCSSSRCLRPSGRTYIRQRNWFTLYCPDKPGKTLLSLSAGSRAAKCSPEGSAAPMRCFTSADSNWSNNPMMLNVDKMFTQYPVNPTKKAMLAQIGLEFQPRRDNGMYEVSFLDYDWGKWKVPMCLAYNGLFRHKEIDGRR